MLTITFPNKNQWWVPGKVFDRLFTSALAAGDLPGDFVQWQHTANANGGLDFGQLDQNVAKALATGLNHAAQREAALFSEQDPSTEDGDYAASLRNCISASQ